MVQQFSNVQCIIFVDFQTAKNNINFRTKFSYQKEIRHYF